MSSGSIAVNTAVADSPGRTKAGRRVFLSARWQALAMLNWEIEPAILEPFVPAGTELDFHAGKTYVSMVGFLFLDTRVLGWPVPLHRNFEEVNLRFYVRRVVGGEVRRGVSFIKEIVPKWAIAQTARWCYNEPYIALPMRHEITGPLSRHAFLGSRHAPHGIHHAPRDDGSEMPADSRGCIRYQWRFANRWNSLALNYSGTSDPLVPGSLEEFIAEHYWGYCPQRDGGTVEYQVEHPPWQVWQGAELQFDCDIAALYTPRFAALLCQPPSGGFLADGSAVAVMSPLRIA
jgi:uncharacterized protein YqjF (DUF2071 family)